MNDIYKTAPVPTIDEVYAIARHHGELAERERIIKLLEDYAQKELKRLRNPDTKVMSELHLAYYEGLLEAMFLIEGEQK